LNNEFRIKLVATLQLGLQLVLNSKRITLELPVDNSTITLVN